MKKTNQMVIEAYTGGLGMYKRCIRNEKES